MLRNNNSTEPALTEQEIEAIGIYLWNCWISDAKIEMHKRSRLNKNQSKKNQNEEMREKI